MRTSSTDQCLQVICLRISNCHLHSIFSTFSHVLSHRYTWIRSSTPPSRTKENIRKRKELARAVDDLLSGSLPTDNRTQLKAKLSMRKQDVGKTLEDVVATGGISFGRAPRGRPRNACPPNQSACVLSLALPLPPHPHPFPCPSPLPVAPRPYLSSLFIVLTRTLTISPRPHTQTIHHLVHLNLNPIETHLLWFNARTIACENRFGGGNQ